MEESNNPAPDLTNSKHQPDKVRLEHNLPKKATQRNRLDVKSRFQIPPHRVIRPCGHSSAQLSAWINRRVDTRMHTISNDGSELFTPGIHEHSLHHCSMIFPVVPVIGCRRARAKVHSVA